MHRDYPGQPAHEGLDAVDAEHRAQIELIDALVGAVEDPARGADPDEILRRFVDYTRMHFLSEELLMRQHAYQHHDEHVCEHRRMLDELEGVERAQAEGRRQDAAKVVRRLRGRLLAHIHTHDAELHRFVSRR